MPELARNVLHLSKTPNHSEKNEKQAHDGDPVEPDADVEAEAADVVTPP
ncbi:MAG: hypothetical protein IPL59_13740 [Candidatus Competibacteraceae bacterium]|nr:hypothetical protein [Candidatus Competibacteraceae bacterium]